MTTLDRRLHAFRPDLASADLRDRVAASQFVEGQPAQITAPFVDLRPAPRTDTGIDTQLLHGATVRVFDEREGWAWLQADTDGYVGYAPASALGETRSPPMSSLPNAASSIVARICVFPPQKCIQWVRRC
jgi:hypothetical protein